MIQREGIVLRPLNETAESEIGEELYKNRVSFKVINPLFLLGGGE